MLHAQVNEKQVTKATNKHRKRSRPKDIFRHSVSCHEHDNYYNDIIAIKVDCTLFGSSS